MKLTLSLLVAFVASCTAQVLPNPCPTGYEVVWVDSMTPVCLKFAMYGKATWYNMRAMCQAEGADLAKLTNNLHYFVLQYISQHPDLQDEAFWIGGTDDGHEGTWTWTVDGTAMDMTHPPWYSTQPNGGTDQNYAALYTPDFYFHSLNGNRLIYGICQI